MTVLPGLLLAVALLQALPGNIPVPAEQALQVFEVIFVIGSVALGTVSMVIGAGVVLEAPVGGAILLVGGCLLSVGVPVVKWVERHEQTEWS